MCVDLEYGFHMTPIWVNQSDKFHMAAICQCYWGLCWALGLITEVLISLYVAISSYRFKV